MFSKKNGAITAICAIILVGCAGNPGSIVPGNNIFTKDRKASQYDGRWVGHYTLVKGDSSCPKQGPMNIQVERGILYAKTTMNGYVSRWQGEIVGNTVTGETERKDTISGTGTFKGTMANKVAEGMWNSKVCSGTWRADRVK